MKSFFRVFGYDPRLRVRIPSYAVFVFLSVIFSIFNLALLIPLLKVLFQTDEAHKVIVHPGPVQFTLDYLMDYFSYYFSEIINTKGPKAALFFVCIFVFVSSFLTNVFRYLGALVSAKTRLDVVKYLRMDIYQKVTAMHLAYFTNERKGDLMSRITNDISEVENSILGSLKSLFREPVTVIIYFIALFKISFDLTIFTIIVLPVAGGALAELVRRLRKRAVQSQESLGRIVNILDETLGGMRIVKAFNARKYVHDKVDKETDYYRHVNLSYAKKKEMGSPISEFLGIGIVLIILYYGGTLVLNNTSSLDASQFITYLVIFSQIISPAKAFSQAFSSVQKGIASANRIFSVVDARPKITNKKDSIILDRFSEFIEFQHVDFAYEDEPVLRDLNLIIRKGETVALVGASGGGKSTIADLIPRFYDPTGGEVLLDGYSLKEYDVESIRKQIGIVTQESILFNDTIFNNIAFGIDDPDPEKVIEAARVANAHDFIMEMTDGYDTNIGDRGQKLSGGQRQRLSIARAVMKNPPILILDEATSALDSESERLVQEALANLMKNRTSLMIAHRLSTIQHATLILVIQQGQVIERGTHTELIAADGVYKKLSSMQNT